MKGKLAIIGLILFTVILGHTAMAEAKQYLYTYYRAYSPFPVDYLARLKMLWAWNSSVGNGLNCSGFICNAHSEPFRTSHDFYFNRKKDLILLAEVADRSHIDESKLQPGDIAAFEGLPSGPKPGVHVTAYLGDHVWAGGNGQRGYVAFYHLAQIEKDDPFFVGHVRLYRWKNPPHFSLLNAFSNLGKDNRSRAD